MNNKQRFLEYKILFINILFKKIIISDRHNKRCKNIVIVIVIVPILISHSFISGLVINNPHPSIVMVFHYQ